MPKSIRKPEGEVTSIVKKYKNNINMIEKCSDRGFLGYTQTILLFGISVVITFKKVLVLERMLVILPRNFNATHQ